MSNFYSVMTNILQECGSGRPGLQQRYSHYGITREVRDLAKQLLESVAMFSRDRGQSYRVK